MTFLLEKYGIITYLSQVHNPDPSLCSIEIVSFLVTADFRRLLVPLRLALPCPPLKQIGAHTSRLAQNGSRVKGKVGFRGGLIWVKNIRRISNSGDRRASRCASQRSFVWVFKTSTTHSGENLPGLRKGQPIDLNLATDEDSQ